MPLLANPVADFSEDTWWIWLIKALFILVFLLLSVLMALWVERRVLGRMQTRWGPNVHGPLGLYVRDVDAAYAHAVACGATGDRAPFDIGDMRIAFVSDPEGHQLEFLSMRG